MGNREHVRRVPRIARIPPFKVSDKLTRRQKPLEPDSIDNVRDDDEIDALIRRELEAVLRDTFRSMLAEMFGIPRRFMGDDEK